MVKITVPCSTANLGPGFDVLGAGLSLYLVLTVEKSQLPVSVITYEGNNASTVALEPSENFIAQMATYVANTVGKTLPTFNLHINNPIPLGRGLGSSGSAIIGAIAMADYLLDLKLNQHEILDYGTLIEGHPDNVAGSLYGSWVLTYCRCELPKLGNECFKAGNFDVPSPASILKKNQLTGHLTRPTILNVNKNIKCVVTIPEFTVATSLARSVLPANYSRSDCVFNMGRVSSLVLALQQPEINARVISESMKDKIHQSYRGHLVPGLTQILDLTPESCEGLLGVCLSGAGPTVLALCNSNFDKIGNTLKGIFSKEHDKNGNQIVSSYMVLEFNTSGLQVE
ncbi:hypothetical protein HDV02_000941 [Globomyces sp. JEL0801]|nr:hypothetical protein HDV02_000941 [Globomyces sp. JEL0801]